MDDNAAYILAVKIGDVRIVNLLLDTGAVDPKARGDLALQLAKERGDERLEALISSKIRWTRGPQSKV